MDPLIGAARLLKNKAIRDALVIEPDMNNLAPGHFLTAKIADRVRELAPRFHEGKPIIPLYLGWWSDAANVSFGGIAFPFGGLLLTFLQEALELASTHYVSGFIPQSPSSYKFISINTIDYRVLLYDDFSDTNFSFVHK